MSSKDSFSNTVRYVLPVTTVSVNQLMKSKTITIQNLSQIEARTQLNLPFEEEEEVDAENSDGDYDIAKEYKTIKKEIKQIKEEIINYNEQIELLNDQISSVEAEKEFLERHAATIYFNDKDHVNRQTRRSKKIVHKQKLLQDLTNELNELMESISPNALFFLKEDVKKEKNELNKVKEKVYKNFEKIKKVEEQLSEERKNPIHGGIKEQESQINDLELSISAQIKEGNRLKRELCRLEILDRENENEIQDLEVQYTQAKYKQEKLQRQYLHILKKQEQQKEEFKCEPTRYVSMQEDDKSRRLFVGIFPQKEMSQQIQSAFSNYGEIEFTKLISLNSKPPKYFSQIQYYDHEAALNAITNLNHTTINGITLNIQWASEQPKTQSEKIKTRKINKDINSKKTLPTISSMNLRPITSRLIHPHQATMNTTNTNKSARP